MLGRVYSNGRKIGGVKPSGMKIGRVCRCGCKGGDKMDIMREMVKEKREE
jgi:hypothetical protein